MYSFLTFTPVDTWLECTSYNEFKAQRVSHYSALYYSSEWWWTLLSYYHFCKWSLFSEQVNYFYYIHMYTGISVIVLSQIKPRAAFKFLLWAFCKVSSTIPEVIFVHVSVIIIAGNISITTHCTLTSKSLKVTKNCIKWRGPWVSYYECACAGTIPLALRV